MAGPTHTTPFVDLSTDSQQDSMKKIIEEARAEAIRQRETRHHKTADKFDELADRIEAQMKEPFTYHGLTPLFTAPPVPAVPEGWKLVPVDHAGKPKVTNEMKARCIGEFEWTEEYSFYDEDGDVHEDTCTNIVPWDLCKQIYKAMASVAMNVSPNKTE